MGSILILKCELCSYYTKTCFSLNRHTKMVHGSERTVVAPNVNMAAPNANTSAPNVNMAAPNVNMAAPYVNTLAPNVNTLAPNVNTSAPNVNTLAPNVNTLAPNVADVKCSTCYKTFSKRSNLTRHIPKCLGKSHQLACARCQQVFSHRSALSRHKKKCSKAVNAQVEDQGQLADHADPNITQKTNCTQDTNCTKETNCTQETKVVKINGLGKEDLTYLTDSRKYKSFMTKCIQLRLDGILDYIEEKHFNPDHPENHNLRKITKKDGFMEFFDGVKWRVRYSKDVLYDVINYMYCAFNEFAETATQDHKFKTGLLDSFIAEIGGPFDWDLTFDNYDYENKASEKERDEERERLFSLITEFIYKKSKEAIP